MVSVQSPPRGRPAPLLRVSLTVLLLAVATTAAALGVTESARVPVICCGGVAALLALSLTAEVLRGHRAQEHLARAHTQEKAALERRVAEYDTETYRMANEVMPVALELTLRGHRATVTENKVLAAKRFANLPTPQRHMLRVFLDAVDEGENVRSGIRFAFISTTRRIQAIAHTLAAELREMEEDHGRNPEVFDDLLRIDHCNSLITRYADNLATIGGGRPSRQWAEPVPLFSLLRGSMSRINEFPRIELENIPDIPIKGTMVEPILQAAAELMDNGARYSPPTAKVHVTALRVRAGIAISVEDAGAPFDEELQQRAMRVFAHSATGRDLGEYKGEPRTGMSVLGRLCRLYRMTLELRSSAYGGLRAILMVPEHMIEGIDYVAPGRAHGIGATAVPRYDENGELIKERRRKGKPEGRRLAGPPLRDADGEPIREAEMPTFTERTAEGLPQRRRRSEHVFAAQDASEPDPFAPAQRSAWEKKTARDPFGRDEHEPEAEQQLPGLALEAFLAGVNGTEQSERQPGTAGRSEAARDDIDEGDHR